MDTNRFDDQAATWDDDPAKVERAADIARRIEVTVPLAADAPPADERFDIIVTVMTLHPLTDLATVLTAFRGLLDGGGHLCIADLEREDGSFHGADFDGHHGFERGALGQQLAGGGFRDVRFEDAADLRKDVYDYRVFLATAIAA